jgi:hypothetical protein
MERARPSVSIVIPTYNRADLLPEAIGSVLAQSVPALEVIVADDASTDHTSEVMAAYAADGRVRYQRGPHQGPAGTRNDGVRAARGEVVGFLDSDDRLLPGALTAHLAAFERQADLGLTVAGYEYVDADGAHLSWRTPWSEGGTLDLRGWLFNCFAMPGSVMLRRAWFERVGGFDPQLSIAEDWHLFMQLAARHCPMAWVREITCQYRQHTGNSSLRLAAHLADSRRALDLIVAQPGLDPEVARLGPAAKAWVGVVFARRALAAGEAEQARGWLQEALLLDPSLGGAQRPALTETLLTAPADWPGTPTAYGRDAARHLPPELRPAPGELRQVLARLELRQFFEALGRGGRAEAGPYLQRGLWQDATWLANRGVLAYLARQLLPSRKPA